LSAVSFQSCNERVFSMAQHIEMLRRKKLIAERRFDEADQAWSKLLPNAVNARYLPIGRGSPGSLLRAAHDKREAACVAWEKACEAFREADLARFRKANAAFLRTAGSL
jgi:hypothetical protein